MPENILLKASFPVKLLADFFLFYIMFCYMIVDYSQQNRFGASDISFFRNCFASPNAKFSSNSTQSKISNN